MIPRQKHLDVYSCFLQHCAPFLVLQWPELERTPVHVAIGLQEITTAVCTYSVESFFIMRMWRLSEQKRLTALVFIPYLVGLGFGLAQIVRSSKVRCNLSVPELNQVFIFVTCACRLFGDGIVVVTMCYMLHVRSLGFTRHTNTIKILRGLILWSISTGVLTWLTSMLFLASYLDIGNLPNAIGIYYVRGGLYPNAMLAQLNARNRFRDLEHVMIHPPCGICT
ncbi:hypothetical protein BYT27DRAFT_7340250 [Phlegmacium glaucopus]|nr:hypothetical protein BYT27DRAFT_7340250 [Phlegmacium glaucopus]